MVRSGTATPRASGELAMRRRSLGGITVPPSGKYGLVPEWHQQRSGYGQVKKVRGREAESGLGERPDDQVGHEKNGERPLRAARLEASRRDHKQHHRRAGEHAEQPEVKVGGEPAAVDGQAIE